MNRRGFLGVAVAAGAALGLGPARAGEKKDEKWWKEEDFVFEGTRATLFWWPKDRPITFDNTADRGGTIWLYPFGLDEPGMAPLPENMRKCVESAPRKWKTLHLHLVRIKEAPDVVGMMIAPSKLPPATDFLPEKFQGISWAYANPGAAGTPVDG